MTDTSYQAFFSYFGLRENPFHVSPDPRFYHSTPAHDSAIQEILFGLQTRQGLLVLTGEAGTGKTTLLNAVLESLAQRKISTAYIFHSLLQTEELLEFILRDFGVNYSSNRKGDLLHALHSWLIARNAAGDSPVVILDEAQSLSLETLDELRLLLNLETPRGKLLQIILTGQSELEKKLRRTELRQLRQRVMFHCKLPRLSDEQTVSYIHSRLSRAGAGTTELFPQATLQCIYTHSKGIPRIINLLCEHALITAYGEQQHCISAESIQRIAGDFDLAAKPISIENEYLPAGHERLSNFPLLEPMPAVVPRVAVPVAAEHQPVKAPAAPVMAHRTAVESAAKIAGPKTQRPESWPRPENESFWRHRRQRSRIPAFLRHAALGFLEYWRQVGQSFVNDCRYFFRPLTFSTPEPAVPLERKNIAAPQRRRLAPVANWLRQPITPGRAPGSSEKAPPASQKKHFAAGR